ncbi:MAG: hypothetical protein HIU87_13375 [Acidobacteria bacterium]|nr:hypothetical protein [Acidobacteriota bacterium]
MRRLSLLALLLFLGILPLRAQQIVPAAAAAKLLPDAVFFRGQSAPVEARNSGGVHYPDGMYVLSAIVDSSGYSSGIQQKYQAYFISEVTVDIEGHKLGPGAYGVGFVNGKFGVMDIAAHDLFSVPATHDAALRRPSPFQVIADAKTGSYRLYFGRNYVVFSRSDKSAK